MQLDGDWPPGLVDLFQRAIAQQGRIGATRIYRVPSESVAAGADGRAISTIFRRAGVVCGLYAQPSTGALADYAGLELRVQFGGSEDLITDGQSGTFAPLLALVGQTQNWFPLMRGVSSDQQWTFIVRNNTGDPKTATILLAVLEDP
jgi:hypothetical protein